MPASGKPSQQPKADPTALGRAFKRRLKSDDVLLGSIASEYLRPSLAKIYANAGFDFIFIEKEHCLFEGSEFTDFVLAARDNQIPVISKVGSLSRSEITRVLDTGVAAIQLPRTETREDVLTLLDLVKFPPIGTRAAAPCFGNVDYNWPDDMREWLEQANQSTSIVAHIETAAGFENAEEIISTLGLDMLYVGPCDFSISLGHPGEYDHPEIKKAMGEILDLCLKYDVPFGTTASGPATAAEWIDRGCRFFEVIDELSLISAGSSELIAAYRR